jgi:GDP-L-fucose synthase
MEKYNDPSPVNIGTGKEIKIRDLANKIGDLMGHEGPRLFNSSYPDGQPRRCLDISKAKKEFDFEAEVSLDEGLKKTIEWFKLERNKT